MKKRIAIGFSFVLMLGCGVGLHAGNPERAGQAGATQLLINPYGRASGLNGANVATTQGIESVANNVAGLALTQGTEVVFSHTLWLQGSDIRINTFGIGQRFRKGGVIGLSVMSFNFGEIERTTIDNPDGGIGTFSPTFLNINASYAKEMVENRIWVGVNVKMIHESIEDVSANGVALDAGVQFRDASGRFRLGVSLRNVGPAMRYSGDGLTVRTNLGGPNAGFSNAVSVRAARFEIPSVLYIGGAYDIRFGMVTDSATMETPFRLTPMLTFMSQAFGRDQFNLGLELAYRRLVAVRVAQFYENQIFSEAETQNAYTGLSAGVSVNIPFAKGSRSAFGVDYSYRHTRWFTGTHVFGFRLNL